MSLKEEENNTELFTRYCRNQYGKGDLNTIFKWFKDNSYDIVRRISMKSYWNSLESSEIKKDNPPYIPGQMLAQIHHKINLEESAEKKQKTNISNNKRFLLTLNKIAAILIIPLVIFTLYMYSNNGGFLQGKEITYSEVFAPKNSRLNIQLPDGTNVWLNHGTSLKYPQQFANDKRQVQLTGEGYFQVEKDQEKPFLVQTGNFDIRVEGTAFNVSAYKDDNSITTTVEEGKVALETTTGNKQKNTITTLTAKQQSVFSKSSQETTIKQVDPKKYVSWKDGKLMLIDDPMARVKKKLERWYNIEVKIMDPKVYDYRYTATFTHESIEQAMKYLSMAAPISYEIKSGEKQEDNTFSKRKVLIGMK
jgi:ferric-dicitrate binding protein FerR (iron transport regulator)